MRSVGPLPTCPNYSTRLAGGDAAVACLVSLYPGIRPVLVHGASHRLDPIDQRPAGKPARGRPPSGAASAERYGIRHEVAGTFVYSLNPEPLAEAKLEELRRFSSRPPRRVGHRGGEAAAPASCSAATRRSTTRSSSPI